MPSSLLAPVKSIDKFVSMDFTFVKFNSMLVKFNSMLAKFNSIDASFNLRKLRETG